MNLSSRDLDSINSYLSAVYEQLTGPDRDETLSNIESHIYEAIAERTANGEHVGVVDAVLAELDSPEQYALPGGSTAIPERRICGLALTGLFLFPWGLLAFWYGIRQTPFGENMASSAFFDSNVFRYLLLPLGIAGPVIAYGLGAVSAKRIRESQGRLYGYQLAVLNKAIAPLLFINMVIIVLVSNIAARPSGPGVGMPIIFGVVVVAVMLNALYLRWVLFSASPQRN